MYKFTRFIYIFISAAAIAVLPTASASAALVKCRTDPIFVLSNGDVITVTLEIYTDPANIKNIHYVLHVPAGVTVKRVAYTALNLGIYETYQVYQDNPSKTYTTRTVVTTITPYPVEVISMTRVNGVLAEYTSGFSGEFLSLTLSQEDRVFTTYRR